MQKKDNLLKLNSRGFGLIDFIIIGAVVGILIFVIVSNIIAHAY